MHVGFPKPGLCAQACALWLLSSLLSAVEVAGCHECILQGGEDYPQHRAGAVGAVRSRSKRLCDSVAPVSQKRAVCLAACFVPLHGCLWPPVAFDVQVLGA